MKLADLIATGTVYPFWLRCDIDGGGPRWRLARFCEMDDDDRGVQIISDPPAVDHFEDWAGNYNEAEVVEILPPVEGGGA